MCAAFVDNLRGMPGVSLPHYLIAAKKIMITPKQLHTRVGITVNTSARVSELLQQALISTRDAERVVNDLIVVHDYQDVTVLVTQAAAALLEAASLLMQSEGEAAFDAMEQAEDLLDSVYNIIDAELDDD